MEDQHRPDESEVGGGRFAFSTGLAAAYGMVLGTILFALTGQPLWIAIGPAFGIVIAAALGSEGDD